MHFSCTFNKYFCSEFIGHIVKMLIVTLYAEIFVLAIVFSN